MARTRLPPLAREIFPVIRVAMPWMETGAGHVELLTGLDNKQWLPVHVEDSWDPDDDMRLMKSVFGHRWDGARVQESLGMVVDQAPLLREEGA